MGEKLIFCLNAAWNFGKQFRWRIERAKRIYTVAEKLSC